METQKSNMQYHLRSIIIDVMWYDMIFQIGHQHIVENVFWIWIKNISKVIFCFKTSTLLPGIYSHISWQFYHEIIQYNWRINWKKSPLGNSPCVLFQQQLEISNRKCCAVHFQKFNFLEKYFYCCYLLFLLINQQPYSFNLNIPLHPYDVCYQKIPKSQWHRMAFWNMRSWIFPKPWRINRCNLWRVLYCCK